MARYSSDETTVVNVEALYWLTATVNFHGFNDLPASESKISPQFSSLGYQWKLRLGEEMRQGYNDCIRDVTLILCNRQKSTHVKVHYQFLTNDRCQVKAHLFRGWIEDNPTWSFDRSYAYKYVKNGTLSIQIRMGTDDYRLPAHTHTFIPRNPSACKTIQDSFMAEDSADVVIKVAEKEGVGAPAKFYAHYFILKRAAPLLAELCKLSNGSQARVHITNESPDIFKDMLLYIYGLPIPALGNDPKRTKHIIETANKYEVTNLKIEAEACYLSSLSFSLGNVAEHLLFADSVNCALLKEKALDFIVDNLGKIAEMKVLTDVTASVLYGVLSAIALKDKKDKGFNIMSVNELRRLSYEKGLDIDGTREMLIAGLKKK